MATPVLANQQRLTFTGCSQEDLPRVMDYRDGRRERDRQTGRDRERSQETEFHQLNLKMKKNYLKMKKNYLKL